MGWRSLPRSAQRLKLTRKAITIMATNEPTRHDTAWPAKLKAPAPPDSRFVRDIPAFLADNKTILTPLDANGYPDEGLKRLPGYTYITPPPLLPCHLERVMLNTREEATLSTPSHAVLNHLYASSIKDGVMAVGSTSRYRSKVGEGGVGVGVAVS
jgi:hypothetical protein